MTNSYTASPGNFALLPLRTRTRGPAQQLPPLSGDVTELSIDATHESYDPLDEILALFRANTFFRNFEIKGPADRVLIYGILYVSEVLSKVKPNVGKRDAEKVRLSFLVKSSREGSQSEKRLCRASGTVTEGATRQTRCVNLFALDVYRELARLIGTT